MPTIYTGASVEPRTMEYWDMFSVRKQMLEEIERRAWQYLKAMGYKWYRQVSITVEVTNRNDVLIVKIAAEFEQNRESQSVELEVPLKQFEALVPAAKAEAATT